MNRRGFLGSLLGWAATPVLASLNFEIVPGFALTDKPIILPTIEGTGRLLSLTASGIRWKSEVGIAQLYRGHLPFFRLTANAYGGLDHWDSALDGPNGAIWFDPKWPLYIQATNNIKVTARYKLDTGEHKITEIMDGKRVDLPMMRPA